MSCNLKEYKEFIDNEMLLILGQMDKATLIFDHVYLVRSFVLSAFFVLFFFSSIIQDWAFIQWPGGHFPARSLLVSVCL